MHRVIGIVCLIITLSACSIMPDKVVMRDVDVNNWHKTISLEFDNKTEQERDLSIMLHVNSRYEAKNIALQIKMYSPDSLCYSEEVFLPSSIEWHLPTASSTDVEIPYRHNVSLKHKGKYMFEITPLECISGVEAAGINFQKN